jgi:transcriptional regulator with XRE-family HTH domain
MSRIAVKPELIRWARERSGITESVLVERFPKYVEWESGQTQPTLRQLENLAKKTMTPFDYLFLPEPPEEQLPIPDFRTVRDRAVRRPSPNLLETIHTMQMRQDWMRDRQYIYSSKTAFLCIRHLPGVLELVGLASAPRKSVQYRSRRG